MILGKKRGVDIDFTLLQKKGLIKKQLEKKSQWKVNKSGFIELAPSPGEMINPSNTSNLGFLENMVNKQNISAAASDTNPLRGFFDNSSGLNPLSPPTLDDSQKSDFNTLKVKLDDLEYKLERLLERIDKLEVDKNNG